LFRLRRGDAGQRPHLGIRELTARERLRQARQRAQGARDANAFAGRAHVEADAPVEPGGAGEKAIAPAGAGVELTDQIEQACGRGVEVSGQLGDLIADSIDIEIWRGILHDESPFSWGESKPAFSSRLPGSRSSDRHAIRVFTTSSDNGRLQASAAWSGIFPRAPHRSQPLAPEAVKCRNKKTPGPLDTPPSHPYREPPP